MLDQLNLQKQFKARDQRERRAARRMKCLLDFIMMLPLLIVFCIESFVKLFIPKKKKSVAGELVLITGAGHGIGRLTAYEFAKLNTKLVLWDINKVTALPRSRSLCFTELHSGAGSTPRKQPPVTALCKELELSVTIDIFQIPGEA